MIPDDTGPQSERLEAWASRHLAPEVRQLVDLRLAVCETCPRCDGFSPRKTAVDCRGNGVVWLTEKCGCDEGKWPA